MEKNNKNSKLPEKLLYNNKLLQDPQLIANSLNKHFAEIGKSNNHTIDFNYITKNLKNSQINSFVFYPATTVEISLIINNLKNKTSEGPDEIPGCIIKKLNNIISPLLTYLINKIINTGKYPLCLKTGKVLPLFKAGDHVDPGNYRPITILPAINKVIEKLIFNRLTEFFEKNKIIKSNQFGFRSGYSTELAVCKFYEDVLSNLNNNQDTCAILLDLSKAFDSVNRNILLHKLYNYGIRGPTYKLLESYLSNRNQFIHVNSTKSNIWPTDTGVPQGSVLSPLLFLILINDLPNCTNMEVLNFADDTLLYLTLPKNTNNIESLINSELIKVNTWMEANQLKLNASKTNYLIFSHRNKINNTLDNLQLNINNTPIKRTKSCKYLGITIDDKLN